MGIKGRLRGLTLVETLLATTILLVAFLTVCELIAVSLHHQAAAEQHMQAYLVAENRLQEIRAQASEPLAMFPDPTWNKTSTEGPFQVVTEAVATPRTTPCAALEDSDVQTQSDVEDGEIHRRIRKSLQQIRVTVRWGSEKISLVTLLGEPERKVAEVQVSETTGKTKTFEARAVDSGGQTIEDVMFDWWAEPSGATCVPVNLMTTADGHQASIPTTNVTTPTGQCRIVACCRYAGQESTGSLVYTVRR